MSTKVINVSKYFDDFKALDHINLTIEEGEFVAILGPSGCGKTTLLRMIAGFDSPNSGEIRFNNELMSNSRICIPPEKRNIGMVFQSFALWPHMTIKEHLRFPLQHHKFAGVEVKNNMEKEIDKILKMTGLEMLANRFPSELSGGQKQRIALARSIIAKPSLLLMDEPLSALDAELRIEMRREIQNIHRLTGTSIVYVTHDQSEALAMADKIVIMKDGKIEQIGMPLEIYTRPETEFVATFVSKANLVRGEWRDDFFHLSYNGDNYIWGNLGVCQNLKDKNIYPIRPDQLKLSLKESGLPAIIKNVQYQGRDIHYSVEVGNELWSIYSPSKELFHIGQKAFIEGPRQMVTSSI